MQTITRTLSETPRIGGRAAALNMMRRDLGSLWSFLASTRIVYRENNLDYLAETRVPHVSTYSVPSEEEKKGCDVILALGSNDLTTPHQAAALYQLISKTNPGIMIVASGKGGHTTVPKPIFNMAEAERYEQELLGLGVPKGNIFTDPLSENSGDNIVNSFSLLTGTVAKSKIPADDLEKIKDRKNLFVDPNADILVFQPSVTIAAISELGISQKTTALLQQALSGPHKTPPKRVAIVQTPAAQLRANLTFEKQWGDKEWEYYISYPPALPKINALSEVNVDYYLAYALREAITTCYYINGPEPQKGRFVTKFDFPNPILNLMGKYGDLLCGENQNLDQLYHGIRGNFDAEEAPYLK